MMTLTASELDALWLSIKVAVCCTGLVAVPAIGAGWLLSRVRFPGKVAVDALVHAPLVMPPVVMGYLLLIAFSERGYPGRWLRQVFEVDVAFTWYGAVLASAVMAFPLAVRSIRLAIDLVDRKLEGAAATLGARPVRVFMTITLPLALPGILTGLVLAFARSLGEFGATITFVGNIAGETRTLPLAIYTYTQIPGNESATARLVIVSIVLSFGALLLSELFARKTRRLLGEP